MNKYDLKYFYEYLAKPSQYGYVKSSKYYTDSWYEILQPVMISSSLSEMNQNNEKVYLAFIEATFRKNQVSSYFMKYFDKYWFD